MDSNNWRPAQSDPLQQQQQQLSSLDIVGGVGGGGVDDPNWRAGLLLESRQRIVNKIMDTLKRHLPFSGLEGLNELKKIAVRFEEKIYTAASSQSDYLRKISLKMLTMENKNQPNGKPPPDQASQSMQSQVLNQGQGQSIPIPLSGNQSQARQQLLPQNNLTSAGVQSSAGIQSSMPLVNTLNQNSAVQNSSGVSQNVIGNSIGQGLPSNVFTNSQRQMQGRQQVTPHQQQNPQYLYQQQFQQQIMKQKQQQGNMQHSLMQPHIQPQQQNIIQSSPLQSSQQSNMQTSTAMQPSVMQTTPLSTLQQTQQSTLQQSTQSMLQQHPQSVLRQQPPQQASSIHQQHTQIMQQPMLSAQQQQQLIGQQPNITNLQQNQLIGQQSSLTDMQQQQRLLSQQNNNPNLQQQQLMTQQNSLSNVHQPQMGSQNNTSGSQQQQQQQLLGTQSVNTGMQTNQHPLHMLQQSKVPMQQQTQQPASNSLLPQGQQQQQQQQQQPQQQLMSQIQSQAPQLQQQLNLQQQNPLQRLQTSNILQPHNVIDQQKQLFLSQRNLPEASSTSLDSTAQTGLANAGDWQEEAYQKLKTMKELYFPDLNEMYMKVAGKLNQHESLPQQPGTDQLGKLRQFKVMLERLMSYLQVSKSTVTLSLKDKIGSIEKQIISFLNSNRPRKPVSSIQQGQLPPPHMHSLQQSQQAQSQMTQVQPHENQTNSQLQPMNLQQNSMKNIQHGSMTSLSVAPNGQQNMLNTIQSGSNLDSGQGNALNSLQQVAGSAPNQTTINTLSSSQGGVNVLQPSINGLQSNSNMMQHSHLKQQQEQHMIQTQFKQQYQQRQIQQQQQQQMIQKQQILQQQQQQQQLHQQTKQQPTQSQTHQMPQLHQMNDADMKIRQGMGVKPGVFLQHHAAGQRSSVYHQHQIKSGGSFPISSPQLVQTASPQNPQQSSPQIDQQNMLSSFTKAGTPLQSTHSPFMVPSPQTSLAPSPMPGDPDNKHASGITSIANAGNIGLQQANGPPAQSLAIGTPGMSASPLLAEFTSQDGNHGNASTIMSGRSNATEQPLERLLKAVKVMSSKALTASISDISSVVSMIDRIAGSAPGNGSRATVGEDLVAMTKCRLQARNFITQDGSTGTKRMRRYTSAMPLVVVSSFGSVNGSSKQLTGSETYDLESTATSITKRPRIEVSHTLLEEIREINQRLIDTVVDVSDEDADPTAAAAAAAEGCEGTIVKCSFSAVALSPNLKSQYSSAQMSPIQPLRLLVPNNYPNCSPVLLDKFPVEVSKEHEDLSAKAKSRFSISLRCLSQPMSLGEIARTWDVCARAVILEYAQQSGGGSFSSRYGSWENCLTAA